jgi:membrane protease YdiL (CAAX protease family)
VLAVLHNLPVLGGDTSHISLEYFTSLEFFATVAFWDTAVIALLMRVFLALSRENPRDVFLGTRPVFGEAWRGLALVPVAFILVVGLVAGLRAVAPWMHNVQESPLEQFMRTPLDAAIFLVVVVLAGGVREELQRGFILHRFEQRLGGIRVGLAVFSLVFGALHFEQGYDVALAVGVLGLMWGLFYLRRRSIVMGVVNHAGFDALQVIQVLIARSLGL